MPTLQAPNGARYVTDNPAEVRDLTLGHGYRVMDEQEPAGPVTPDAEPATPTEPVIPTEPAEPTTTPDETHPPAL